MKMNSTYKIAVVGTGKTGRKVCEMLGENLSDAFNSRNPPTAEILKKSDAVIIFVPGEAVEEILPAVLESGIPAAWGTTGFNWPDDLEDRVKARNAKWVMASNFSLGMNIVRKCIEAISEGSAIFKNPEFRINEVHHIHKKDKPSGTALSWSEWLDKDAEISSERRGDVNGIHELSVLTSTEKIELRHEALDRKLFAEGAIWAAEQLIHNKKIESGIISFAQLFDKVMEDKL